MKKAFSYIVILLFLSTALHAALFSGYDFTFFDSVAKSVAISDSERIGFDYTGYGYFGDMTTGIFLRLGIQAPYSTLLYTFDDLIGKTNEPTKDTSAESGQTTFDENQLESRMREYKFLVAIGPAFRRFVSPALSWYMGLGLKAEIDRLTYLTDSNIRDIYLSYLVSTDIDFGFRITADIHTSLRIGVYLTRPLFTLNQSYSVRSGEESESEYSFIQNIYPDMNKEDKSTSIVGYISLGHTYTDYLERIPYRYIITSREVGKGILEPMEEETE